jgi:hypothetical protein
VRPFPSLKLFIFVPPPRPGQEPGGTYTDLIINPFVGSLGAGALASVTVSALEPGVGHEFFSFDYTLGNGNNFLTIVATGGS